MSPEATVILRERVASECRLESDDVAFLLEEHRAHVQVAPTHQPGCYRLTPAGYVGTIIGPNCRLVIQPKVPLRNLFHLLAPSVRIPLQPDRTLALPEGGALDFLSNLLAALLAERCAAGLHHAYAEREGQGPYLQGALDVAAQLREPGGRRDRLHYRYDDFGPDVLCNQIPKAVVELLLRSPLLSAEGRDTLLGVLPAFAAVQSIPLTSDIWGEEHVPESYRPLLGLCRLLFEGLQPGEGAGPVSSPAFLLDMERVFERYVTDGICRAFAGSPHAVTVQPWVSVSESLPGQPALQMRPDMVIRYSPESLLVVDAKWKRLPRSPLVTEDIYQMLAYCAGLGARRAVLLYPGKRDRVWPYPLVHSPITVEVRTLHVTGSRRECRRSLAQLARELRDRLSH